MPDQKRTASPDWEDLRHFAALAREGTLSGAARALGVTHATVGRRLAALEATLGRTLFDRRAEGYALTPDGRAALAPIASMDEAVAALLRGLDTDPGLHGPVTLTTVRAFADGFLAPRLGELALSHPGIALELATDPRNRSLARREADLAVRQARPTAGEALASRIGAVAFRFCAAPAYLARRPVPDRLIGFDAAADLPEALWLARHAGAAPFAFRSNSQAAQLGAARAGFGIALLPAYLLAQDDALTPVDFAPPPPDRELWLLLRRDLARVARVRAVADLVRHVVTRDRAVLLGRLV